MKRTPLRRKTPLRSKSQLTKSRLKPMSDDKREWQKKYSDAKKHGSCYVRPADRPFVLEHKQFCSPHHPFGRQGDKILAFLWMTWDGHNDKHDNAKKAYEDGWLHPPFRGMPLNPKHPRPWPVECEEHWPAKYRRVS